MTKQRGMVVFLASGTIWLACAVGDGCKSPTIIGPDGAAGSTAIALGGSAGGTTAAFGGAAGIGAGGAGGSTAVRIDGSAGDTTISFDGAAGNTAVPFDGGAAGGTTPSLGGSTGRGGAAGSTAISTGGRTGRGGSAGNTAISTGGTAGSTASSNGGAAGSGGVVLDGGDLKDAGGSSDVAGSSQAPVLAGCRIFPPDNPWNQDVSGYPLNADSATYLANMSAGTAFHPDWGTVSDGYGIPFSSGTGATAQPITWTESWGNSESDPLACPSGGGKFCYPIPLTAPIEGGPSASTDSDRHVLYLDTAGAPDNCTLYELYNAQNPTGTSGWTAANGAIFHLGSNALRTAGWTSADAAGLPILPGLVRFDEVMAGEIRHAIRFTVSRSSQGYIHPATHAAGSSNASLPPMGLRLRLKASFDTSKSSGPTLVILTAMKKYGIILADNGSNWYITGESNEGWAPHMDNLLSGLRQLHGTDFEVVDTGPVSTEGL
jgi:hypothetical protein